MAAGGYVPALIGSLPVRLPCSLSQICLLGPRADYRKFPSDILRGPAMGGIPGLCKALPRKGQRSGAHRLRLGEDGMLGNNLVWLDVGANMELFGSHREKLTVARSGMIQRRAKRGLCSQLYPPPFQLFVVVVDLV